jgi:uridine kinase
VAWGRLVGTMEAVSYESSIYVACAHDVRILSAIERSMVHGIRTYIWLLDEEFYGRPDASH